MKTIYIKMFAGLGNQLFQYSYASYLKELGHKTCLVLNKNQKGENIYDFPDVFETNKTRIFSTSNPVKLFLIKFWAKYIIKNWYTGFYQEYLYPESISILPRFKNYTQYIKNDIYLQIKSCTAISLHIRGGDYLSTSANETYGNICTKEYYIKAIKFIVESNCEPTFFIFSNEKEYASTIIESFPQINYVMVPEPDKGDPGLDLFLMSECNHNIIANSTFSWWGAYLNKNKNKIVICPSKWTNDNQTIHEKIVIPTWKSL